MTIAVLPREPAPKRATVDLAVAIIGTGFSGLGAAIKLKQSGENDFVLFERAAAIGGTWRDNTYPGAACDIRANLYSFSFAPKPDWQKAYGTRDELDRYLNDCAQQFGLLPHVRFDHELLEARWNTDIERWELETSHGRYTARVLVSAMGYLSEPNLPDIPGIDRFTGDLFHTARWNHNVDLRGKRVAVIGTGASSVQLVPAIQAEVAQLDVYQRSPAWIMEKHDSPNIGFRGWAMGKPWIQRLNRAYNRYALELLVFQLARPRAMVFIKQLAVANLKKNIKDRTLREQLTPSYTMGCKRMLFSSDYYPALQKTNVNLICDGITQIKPRSITTGDETDHPADVVVMATGFQATRLPFANRIRGVDDQLLAEAWRDGQYAYLGTTVPGFPNLFIMLGPNTTVGHTSATLMCEAQAAYLVDAVRTMRRHGFGSVDVKTTVAAAYNRKLQARMARTVWNAGGCNSWYLNESGLNTAIWPRTTVDFGRRTRRFDVTNYATTTAPRSELGVRDTSMLD